MTPCLRISKKVRDRVFRLWRSRPDLCFDDAAAQLGYSPTELTRLTRRWVRASSRAYRRRFPKADRIECGEHVGAAKRVKP